ncbi:MAG: hypothetical protein ABIJ75_00965, partial [Actinomycetota bacterium]
MAQTPRELVQRSVRYQSPERIPRDLWLLPWAEAHHGAAVARLKQRFPTDFGSAPAVYQPSPRASGSPYAVGEYV